MCQKKIAVTGALGHIGSKLIHGIRPGQYREIQLIDNLSTQRFPSLFFLPKGVPYRFFEEDILTADLEKRFRGVSAVVHLAAISTPEISFDRQAEVERVNFEGTRRVAEACAKTGARLLFISTTSIYSGKNEALDENSSGEKIQPHTPYAQSKLRGENILSVIARESKLRFTVLRFGTIFGPSLGMRFHAAVNRFCWQACQGKPLSVYETALLQQRPYLDVADAARAIEWIIGQDLFGGELYNAVTCNATVKEVVAMIRKSIPSLKVKRIASKAMNDYSYTVSSQKIQSLGFRFKGNMEKGIKDTIQFIGPSSIVSESR